MPSDPPQPSVRARPHPTEQPVVQSLLLHPARWEIWPALAVLRWMQRQMRREHVNVCFRAKPRLAFAPSEIDDISLRSPGEIEVVINALGLASTGSALPSADIARIIADQRSGGASAAWLDLATDRLMHAAEASMRRSACAFSWATGGRSEASRVLPALVGRDAMLAHTRAGQLRSAGRRTTERLDGLSAPFAPSTPSAAGLARAVEAYTGLETQVRECTGAELEVARPARIRGPRARILGRRRRSAAAGVAVRLDARAAEERGVEWAADETRVDALYELSRTYIGDSAPIPSLEITVAPGALAPARPGDPHAVLGRSAVLQTRGGAPMTLRVRAPR